MPEAALAPPDDFSSLPGFDWQPLEPAARIALARDWNLSLPDPPLDLGSAVASVAALPFYRDYRLLRVAAAHPSGDEPGIASRAVYLLHAPGDLRPLDSSLRGIDRVNLLSPLRLDAANVAQYVALRLAFEHSRPVVSLATGRAMLLAVIRSPAGAAGAGLAAGSPLLDALDEPVLEAAPDQAGRPDSVRGDEVFRLRIGLAVPGDPAWSRRRAEAVVTPAGAVTLVAVEEMPQVSDAALERHAVPAALAHYCVRIRPGCAWLEWRKPEDKPGQALLNRLGEWISKPEKALLRTAPLPWYRHYQLVELSEPGPRGWQRSYAMVAADEPGIEEPVVALNGTSPPIHKINAIEGELQLDAHNAPAYLAFFCWAVQGEKGSFLIAKESWHEIPLERAPDDDQRARLAQRAWGIHPADAAEERDKVFRDRPAEEHGFRTTVAYSNAVFEAWMAVLPDGMVEMLEDQPLMADLPTRIEKFGSTRLGIPRRRAHVGHYLLGAAPIDPAWLLGSIDPAAATTRRQLSAQQFVEALRREARLADLEVTDGPVEWAPDDANDRRPRLIRNCVLRGGLLAGSSPSTAPVSLVHCLIEGGFSARGAELNGPWLFVECRIGADQDIGSREVAIDLDNARFADDVEFFSCAIYGRLSGTSLRAQQHLRIRGCCFARSALNSARLLRVADIDEFPERGFGEQRFGNPPAIILTHAQIAGELEIGAASNETERRLGGARSALVDDDAIATLINGALDLSAITAGSVWLSGTVCDGYTALDYAVIGKELVLCSGGSQQGAAQFRTTTGLSLVSARIGGRVSLNMARVGHDLSLYLAHIEGTLSLGGMRIGGKLDGNFATVRGYFTAFLDRDGITSGAAHLSIGGDLQMSGCDIRFCELRGVDIKGDLTIGMAKFERLMVAPAIEFTGRHANGNPQYWIQPNRIGCVKVRTVTVAGDLVLAGILTRGDGSANRRGDEPTGFCVQHCTIGGDLAMSLQSAPDAHLITRFDGEAVTINWQRPAPAPDAPGTRDDGNGANASPLAKPSHEDVRSKIWGDLDLRANTVGGRLILRNVEVEGQIRLNDTHVILDVEMNGDFTLDTETYNRLRTRSTRLDLEKLNCDGDVILTGLRVEPRLDSNGHPYEGVRHIEADLHGTLSARDMAIKGDLRFGAPEAHLRQSHEPLMAIVDGDIDLSGVSANRLVLSGGNLGPNCDKVLLERGQFGRFDMIDPPPTPVELSGIRVDRWYFISGHECKPAPVGKIVAVLRKMPTFDRMAWIDIETGLRNEGRDIEANEVYVSMRREARKHEGGQRLRDHWGRFKDQLKFLLTAYGTAVGRPMWPFLPILLLSWWIFSNPCNVAATTEMLQVLGDKPIRAAADCRSGPGAAALPLAISPTQLGMPWRFTDAVALTVRYQVPIIGVLTHNRWEASPRSLPGGFLSAEGYAFWVELYFWIAWPLFLIGVAARAFRGRRDG